MVWNECDLKWMWSQMNVVSNEYGLRWSGLKWSGLKWMWSQMKWSQMNLVSNECGLKWLWPQMNVVQNECGLKWVWSQMKWSKMKKSHMNVVSNEQVSNIVVSNERGLNCLHTACIWYLPCDWQTLRDFQRQRAFLINICVNVRDCKQEFSLSYSGGWLYVKHGENVSLHGGDQSIRTLWGLFPTFSFSAGWTSSVFFKVGGIAPWGRFWWAIGGGRKNINGAKMLNH